MYTKLEKKTKISKVQAIKVKEHVTVLLDLNFTYHWVLTLFKLVKKVLHKSFNYSSFDCYCS